MLTLITTLNTIINNMIIMREMVVYDTAVSKWYICILKILKGHIYSLAYYIL